MSSIAIRKVTAKDLEQLKQVSRLTFFETFSAENTEENMQQYLEEGFSDERLAAELEEDLSEFYFAVRGRDIIGYLKLNVGQAQTEQQDDPALEIERIYVLKEFQGMKVGQLLYEKAVQMALQKGVDYIWLGVWEKNTRAISFYKKIGFAEFDQHVFKLGKEEQTDILMKFRLKDQRV